MEAEGSNYKALKPNKKPTRARLYPSSIFFIFFFAILAPYALFKFFLPTDYSIGDTIFSINSTTAATSSVILAADDTSAAGTTSSVKVFLHDLPRRFTYGVIAGHSAARGRRLSFSDDDDVSSFKYPGHQHMAEWYLFTDLNRPESERFGSPVTRVMDPDEADIFYMPFFSSLSLIVNTVRPGDGSDPVYSDEESQEALVEWLEEQEHWRRNNGRDHVIIASDPNALHRVMGRVRNSVLLVSDFGRLRREQGSLVKDVVVPYSHRIRTYEGDVGIENRNTLLFFMGNRHRKDGGKIRDILFQILENEEDVIIKHGTQSTESRRAASHGMHTSKFCLHPAGDTPSACRLFDAIVSLCVPVVVSDYIELPFEDVIDYRKIAIFVESALAVKPGYLVSKLRAITLDRILEYQKELKEVKQYFQYGVPNGTVNEIWRQVVKKLPVIKLMINRDKRLRVLTCHAKVRIRVKSQLHTNSTTVKDPSSIGVVAVPKWSQKTITLPPQKRGCHLITSKIVKAIQQDLSGFKCGLAHLFLHHTSASLTINENYDYDVPDDTETFLNRIVPEGPSAPWKHTLEGYRYKWKA